MTARREKHKQERADSPPQAAFTDNKKQRLEGTWKENLGRYLIDISKYVVTGVLITSIFKDLDDKAVIYVLSVVVALIALIVGLVLTNKKKGD